MYKKFIELLSPREQKQLPGLLFLILIGMLLEALGIGMVIPALTLMTQNNVLANHPVLQPLFNFLGNPGQRQLVIEGMLALLGLYAFKTGFLMFMIWRQNRYIFGLQESLSKRLFTGYLSQPWSFHLQRNSGPVNP